MLLCASGPTELTSYSDKNDDFKKFNAQVLGVSVDSQYAHLEWSRKKRNEGDLIVGVQSLLLDSPSKSSGMKGKHET